VRRTAIHDALGVTGDFPALHADRAELYDFVGGGEEFGHGAERDAAKVLVQPSADDFAASVG